LGGDTYTVNGALTCFSYVRSHYRAVKALTDGKSKAHRDIVDDVAWEFIDDGIVQIDDVNCDDEHGWLGCVVSDGDGTRIGEIGARCNKPAGYDTDHFGTGRCKFHGGGKIHSRIRKGMEKGWTSKHLRGRLENLVVEYMMDPMPLDLHKELAYMRAFVEIYRDHIVDKGDASVLMSRVPDMIRQIERVGVLVDKMVSIDQKYALTASQLLYVQSTLVDIMKKYLKDPEIIEMAANELSDRLGTGDRSVILQKEGLLTIGPG